jgi:hypothetical protein
LVRGHNESERVPFPNLGDGRVKSQDPPTDNSNSLYTPPQPPTWPQSHYQLTQHTTGHHCLAKRGRPIHFRNILRPNLVLVWSNTQSKLPFSEKSV